MLLASLQFLVAWASTRWKLLEALAKSTPRAHLVNGVLQEGALRAERMTPEEIHAAVRSFGHGGLDCIAAVVLETDGSLSVVPAAQRGDGSALKQL